MKLNEIEKMLETTVGKQSYCTANDCLDMSKCEGCCFCKRVYPSFTAEKQYNILKIIVHSFGFNSLDRPIWDKGWDIAIAKLVNNYWEVLPEVEKQQIKVILNGN